MVPYHPVFLATARAGEVGKESAWKQLSTSMIGALLGSAPERQEKFELRLDGKSIGKCVREQGRAVKISLMLSAITGESIDSLVEVLRGCERSAQHIPSASSLESSFPLRLEGSHCRRCKTILHL